MNSRRVLLLSTQPSVPLTLRDTMKILLGILFFPFVALFLMLMLVTWIIFWIFGVPIAIRRGGRVIGEIRWFKYIPFDNKSRF